MERYAIYCPYCGTLGLRKIGVGEIQDEVDYGIYLCNTCDMGTKILMDNSPVKEEPKWALYPLDLCLPDYFGGYHKPVMAIPVYHGMKKEELVDAIVSEYNDIYDHLSYGENGWPDFSSEEIRKMAEEFITEDVLFLKLEKDVDEDDESVYFYISCEKQG